MDKEPGSMYANAFCEKKKRFETTKILIRICILYKFINITLLRINFSYIMNHK